MENRALPEGPVPIRAAATRVDITPRLWLPATGFSLAGSGACWEVWNRLFASVILVEDDQGERAVLIGADLHVGSRLVLEGIAARLPAALRIGQERILFSASHTHFAPGNFYGHSYFDMLTGRAAGRHAAWVDWLAARLAAAIVSLPAPVPAKVGYARVATTGLVENRSLTSFRRNFVAPGQKVDVRAFANAVGNPGGAGVRDEELAVDPNVHVLWLDDDQGRPIGGFASFGAHPTVTGPKHRTMTSDAFGVAVRHARDAMWHAWGARAPIALVSGSTGDTLFIHAHAEVPKAWRECDRVGARLGERLWDGIQAARANATANARVEILHRDVRAPDSAVEPPVHGVPRRLASAWWVGEGVTRGGLYQPKWQDLPPNVAVPPAHPQWPKRQQVLQAVLGGAFEVPEQIAVRVLRVGPVQVVGLPGEPTTMLAHRVRERLGSEDVLVCGYSGGYVGYLPTPEEYEHQDYEGASALWGRWTGDWIVEQVGACADGKVTASRPAGFTAHPAPMALTQRMKLANPATSTRLEVERVPRGWKLTGSWCPTNDGLPPLSGPPDALDFPPVLVFQEEHAPGKWRVLRHLGEPATDQTRDVRLWLDLSQGRYAFEWVLPLEAALAGRRIRYEVAHPGLLPQDPRSNVAPLP